MRVRSMIAPTVCVLALAAWVGPPAAAQAPVRVGVFDSARVSLETVEGTRVQAELQALTETKRDEISKKEQRVIELQDQLSKQALSLSPERRAALEVDIKRKTLEINNARELATRELELEIRAAEANFNDKLRAVIEQFARDEEFALILEYGAVAWAAESIDLTTAIIDLFNEMFPGTAAGTAGQGD